MLAPVHIERSNFKQYLDFDSPRVTPAVVLSIAIIGPGTVQGAGQG